MTPTVRDEGIGPVAEEVLSRLCDGDVGDVRAVTRAWTTIRFANGRVHQPHFDRESSVSLRVARGRHLGTAVSADLSDDAITELVATARSLAAVAPVERRFSGFPRAKGRAPRPVAFAPATAATSPEAATRIAEHILDAAGAEAPAGRVAGVVNVGATYLTVANSAGLLRSTRVSGIESSVLVDRPDRDPPVSGWSEGAHWDASQFDARRLGREAAERVATTAPESCAPATYRVVLRGPAMAELASFLGHLGFNGHGEREGWSCLKGKRGRRIAPAFVTLTDDARSRDTIPRSIDFEGVETRATPLVDRGIAGPAVTDLVTADQLKRKPSGHGPPPESPSGDWGPLPNHLLLDAGDASEEELVREAKDGLLVTRFHYVRIVDAARGVITGMTRDGTYRIANGEVVAPVKNLRFTESVLTALRTAELFGKERRIYADERATQCATVPSALVGEFRFTSATLF